MLNILISLILFTLCLSDVTDISELMSSIDLTETSIISYLNTTSEDRIQNAAALSVTGKIIMNDLYLYSLFDFTGEINNYTCLSSMCRITLQMTGSCLYNQHTKFAHCSCTGKNGAFCMYEATTVSNKFGVIDQAYTILRNKIKEIVKNQIQSAGEFTSMLDLIEYAVPFYFFFYENNYNDYYKKIDLFNRMLFYYTNYKAFSPFDNTTLSRSKEFLYHMLYQSFFSFEFDYISFIELFLNNTDYTEEKNNFLYGRNSTLINPFANQTVFLGNTTIIQNLAIDNTNKSINSGSMGYPDLNSQIKITFPKQLSKKLFDAYIEVDILNKWLFALEYVVTFIHNHNAYYVKGGIKPVTPIVGLGLFKRDVYYERYTIPKGDYYHIEVRVPWSFEKMIFRMGDMKSNCNVVKWNQTAKMWFPSVYSFIDVKKSDEYKVTFYVNELGTYAVSCRYYTQRNAIINIEEEE